MSDKDRIDTIRAALAGELKAGSASVFHKRLPDFEAVDEVTIRKRPRFKTSGLSGDEWRTSVCVEFRFKGQLVHELWCGDMASAMTLAPARLLEQEDGAIWKTTLNAERVSCDQPGCSNKATTALALRRTFSSCGEELREPHQLRYYRQFCGRHVLRGDASMEDADSNYELVSGSREPMIDPSDESPSVFGGVIDLTGESDDDREPRDS